MKVVARPSGEPYGRLQGNRGTLALLGSPSGAARRRLGLAFAIYNGSTIPLSAPRGLCENHPNLGAELPLPLGAARLGGVEVRGAASQRWLCRVPLRGVGSCVRVPPTIALGTPNPAPPSALH